jgi:hypothetical protein
MWVALHKVSQPVIPVGHYLQEIAVPGSLLNENALKLIWAHLGALEMNATGGRLRPYGARLSYAPPARSRIHTSP